MGGYGGLLICLREVEPTGSLRKEKQGLAQGVFSGSGEQLMQTGDMVKQWRKYFEELNLTSISYEEEKASGFGPKEYCGYKWTK